MRVLAIVAHPDDETLGCGATLAKHAAAGDSVSIQTFTDGVSSRAGQLGDGPRRRYQFGQAMVSLGISWEIQADVNICDLWPSTWLQDARGAGWYHLDYADQRLDVVDVMTLARSVEVAIEKFKPQRIYTHWRGDLNADHRRVAEAVAVATRPVGSRVSAVHAFETPSASEWAFAGEAFAPNVFIEATPEHLDRKLKAMACYVGETGDNVTHPRSPPKLLALAAWRGATIGAQYAEAFLLQRQVVWTDMAS